MSDAALHDIDVAVLAGGLGTRLAGVLADRPKILAPVAGRPFLDHLLAWLERFGARRIVLCLGHRADAVLAHLAGRPPGGTEIVSLIEPAPLGTAGALRFARTRLRSDPVLVANGDSFVDADLAAFLDSHRRSGAAGSLLCTEIADAGRYGRVELDRHQRIRRFAEKDPAASGGGLINAGIYLLGARLLDGIAGSAAGSLEREVFAALAPGTLHGFAGRFRFIDIGTPESLAAAQAMFAGAGR